MPPAVESAGSPACSKPSSSSDCSVATSGDLRRPVDLIVELEHPVFGAFPCIRSLVECSRSATLAPTRPALGQHTDTVLAELDLSPDRVASLREEGVID
jgi:crotonobetainyl-CoA:carnitine CoA-transferase CaiB-like acyl-CoA transferase